MGVPVQWVALPPVEQNHSVGFVVRCSFRRNTGSSWMTQELCDENVYQPAGVGHHPAYCPKHWAMLSEEDMLHTAWFAWSVLLQGSSGMGRPL